jgi:hypothetical protein
VRQAVDDRTAYIERKASNCTPSGFTTSSSTKEWHIIAASQANCDVASEPKEGLEELKGFLSSKKQTLLIGSAIDRQARIAKLIMADGCASKAITPTLQQPSGPKRTLIRKGRFL